MQILMCFVQNYIDLYHFLAVTVIEWTTNEGKSFQRYSHIQERKEIFHLTTHSTHFIYGYIASDI